MMTKAMRQSTNLRWATKVLAVLVVLSYASPPLLSQQEALPDDRAISPVLEVVDISGWPGIQERHLYLRVFPDGKVEFQDRTRIDLTQEIPLVRKSLSQEEMAQFMSALNSMGVRKLYGTYERGDMGNAHSIFMIDIKGENREQALEFVNFDSRDLTEGERPYPPDAERLGNLIKGVRERFRSKVHIANHETQSNVRSLSPGVILEVIATDFQAYSQKKYVYARVFEDGLVEYHDPLHVDLLYPAIIRKQLPPQDLAQLRRILSKAEVKQLSGEYHGWYGVDTSVRWDFLVPNGDKTRKFVLWNFTYPERWVPDNTRMIPKEANELGCFLLRIDEQILHFGGMPERCREPEHPQ